MADNWWAKKLGGMVNGGPRQEQRQYEPMAPVGQQPPTWQPPTWQPPQPVSRPQDPNLQLSMGDAVMLWDGGQGTKEETYRCPSCGSGNFFSRRFSEAGMPLRTPPSPQCYDCGYPVVQFGSPSGGGAAAATSGGVHQARQAARPAPPEGSIVY